VKARRCREEVKKGRRRGSVEDEGKKREGG